MFKYLDLDLSLKIKKIQRLESAPICINFSVA